jgi:predicted transcriptional regulator with HTH domain
VLTAMNAKKSEPHNASYKLRGLGVSIQGDNPKVRIGLRSRVERLQQKYIKLKVNKKAKRRTYLRVDLT